jgi:hypothetical protein
MFLRTDRVAQFGVRYFMGMKGYTLEEYLNLIKKFSQQPQSEPEGALIIFADDAEYIGTNGWFRLKYQNEPDNVFEHTPASQQKLIELVSECKKMGSFTTFDAACNQLAPMDETITFDNDSAWHGGKASTWANTPMARLLMPWQDLVRAKLEFISDSISSAQLEMAWLFLTNSYNSDGQWPPTLPEAPHIIHPFNYRYCFDNLLAAELIVGGVDRSLLRTRAASTLEEILGIQQQKVASAAKKMHKTQSNAAQKAEALINFSRDYSGLGQNDKVLYPSEYEVRANALVQARRLVGGIEIENT